MRRASGFSQSNSQLYQGNSSRTTNLQVWTVPERADILTCDKGVYRCISGGILGGAQARIQSDHGFSSMRGGFRGGGTPSGKPPKPAISNSYNACTDKSAEPVYRIPGVIAKLPHICKFKGL